MGNPYVRDGNRGLYKTTNGGDSWEQVLFVDDDAGVIDLVMNPQNPNILYAASWNRVRNSQESIVTGEDAKIWKTTNGGGTWEVLTNGLPTGVLNRIGLDVLPSNPNVLVAVFVGEDSRLLNVYRTDDAGVNAEARGGQPMDWSAFEKRAAPVADLPEQKTDETCYLQYSSGSTRFPHGVAVTHGALLNNLAAHSHGMNVQDSDRCVSWLPWYHDMGLLGCLLSPVANQVSSTI